MFQATSKADRREAILTELADLGMPLARDLQARALAAKDDKAAGDLSLAFHRISRCIRQTLALEARFERDRRQAVREDAQTQAREKIVARHDRRRQVRKAIAPLLWTEGEEEESEALLEALDACIAEASNEDDFLDITLDACIARLREAFGLPAADNDAGHTAPTVTIWRSG